MSIPRSRDLRLLAGAAGLSALGDFMAIFPLILHVQQRTGSAFAVSALIFALWGPVVLAAGVAGAIVDRFENRADPRRRLARAGGGRRRDAHRHRQPVGAAAADGPARLRRRGRASPPSSRSSPRRPGRTRDAARANGLMETARSLGFTAGPVVGGALGAAGLLLARARARRAVVRRRGRRGARCCAPAAARTPPARPSAVRAREGFAFLVARARARDHARRRASPRSRCSRCRRPPSRSSSPTSSAPAASPTASC